MPIIARVSTLFLFPGVPELTVSGLALVLAVAIDRMCGWRQRVRR